MASGHTVDVKQAGKYKILALYSNLAQSIQSSLNNQLGADCKLPVDVAKQFPTEKYPDCIVWHIWNKAECGEITFPNTGLQLLTLHYKKGNNLAYFDFVSEK